MPFMEALKSQQIIVQNKKWRIFFITDETMKDKTWDEIVAINFTQKNELLQKENLRHRTGQ
jgi:hypothetical protein